MIISVENWVVKLHSMELGYLLGMLIATVQFINFDFQLVLICKELFAWNSTKNQNYKCLWDQTNA